ncbi:MAG: adenylate/guanylate cyclase domain-containing protein, partial [Dongiaceae bacterium]
DPGQGTRSIGTLARLPAPGRAAGLSETRRLAAILAADVVGFSRLMEVDEAGTLAALKLRRRDVLDPLVAKHHGRVFKTTGDGVLVEFASAVNAVQCAVDLQQGMAAANVGQPEDRHIILRIGVNLGDVMVEGGDLYGDGVNIAARLEALADPGGILVSGTAHDYVKNKVKIGFEDLGAQTLKNITEPVRAYRITGTPAVAIAAQKATADKPSIAVLPFTNMSGDPAQEYFSDGITEDLTTLLAQWRLFPVIARSSTFSYKERHVDVKQIAQELGARYILEGSVRKLGRQVRVAAQMIDGDSGHHVWAIRYDRESENIFALQDELAHQIAATIVPELERLEIKRSGRKRPTDLGAWDCYLRGLSFLQHFTCEDNAQARKIFEQAIALDPDYADAHAGVAASYHRDLLLECTVNRDSSLEKSKSAARRAVTLDPSSSNAHAVLGTCYIWLNEHGLALAEARRAVELNPSDAQTLHSWGNKADLAGDPEGLDAMVRAQKLNPQDPDRHSHLCFLARAYVNARRYEDAVTSARGAINLKPDYPHAYYVFAIALGHLDRTVEARAALAHCDALQPGFVVGRAGWRPYVAEPANVHLRDGLRKAGLPE